MAGGKRQERARWSVPDRPEWVIIGRNQAKWEPAWEPMGKTPWVRNPGIFHTHVVKSKDRGITRTFKIPSLRCPKCGQLARVGDTLIDPAKFKSQVVCETKYLVEVATDKRVATGLDVRWTMPDGVSKNIRVGDPVQVQDRSYRVQECGEPLWTWTPRPRKWAPAKIVQTQMRNLFDYFLLDEMHEEKSASSAQALAAAKIMGASKRIMGLTGTLIGGYAHHLFPLLMRMAPRTLIEEGFEWGASGEREFSETYGRIDKTYTTTIGGESRSRGGKSSGSTSMRKESEESVTEDVKPGIVSTFFGRHLMDKTVFVTLEEMGDELPEIMDDDRSLVPCDMNTDLAEEYQRVASALVDANKELVLKGSMKLMSCLQQTLLGYPDRPYGWRPPAEVEAYRRGAMACGYFEGERAKAHYNDWMSVVQPADLDQSVLYPKEKALFDICHKEACEGRQTWVYVMQTGKRDIQGRLKAILESGGLKVGVLRQSTAEPRERMEWIKANGPKNRVIISHPQLVSTGLDFFDKAGSFNYCSLVFYQSTYDVNLMRQAGRRHWRVGQVKECRNFYLYYKQTMQHQAVKHIGEKYAAAKSLEGKFSAEGLAAMAEGGIGMTEMAAAMSRKIEDPRGSWGKLRAEKPKPTLTIPDDVFDLFASIEIDDDTLAFFAGVGAA